MAHTTLQARVPAGVNAGGRFTTTPRVEPQLNLATEGVPCVRHPYTQLRHYDGPCQCFFGGPQPQFAPMTDPAAA
ncbi:hypothetical protein [Pseudactinotalea terrae]|uniref:hypothetical protein n=1 Tax=Pseudactinotalea terrae TaxID=1743262 RepID=UPI0012E208EA|nr:hypothetical protein [Pseudactinotalea terrae]